MCNAHTRKQDNSSSWCWFRWAAPGAGAANYTTVHETIFSRQNFYTRYSFWDHHMQMKMSQGEREWPQENSRSQSWLGIVQIGADLSRPEYGCAPIWTDPNWTTPDWTTPNWTTPNWTEGSFGLPQIGQPAIGLPSFGLPPFGLAPFGLAPFGLRGHLD